MLVEPTVFYISGDEQQSARRSPVGRGREPPLVWQGEMLYCHRRNSSMVEEGGQIDRRVVFGPRDGVFVERSLSGRSHCCCRLCTTAVVAKAIKCLKNLSHTLGYFSHWSSPAH